MRRTRADRLLLDLPRGLALDESESVDHLVRERRCVRRGEVLFRGRRVWRDPRDPQRFLQDQRVEPWQARAGHPFFYGRLAARYGEHRYGTLQQLGDRARA